MQKHENSVKARESSFELLRIISMFSIVAHHFAAHGEFSFDSTALTIPRLWWLFIDMGGKWGVDIFVLISGYFLINDKGPMFNLRRLLKLWGQIIFYSIVIYMLYICGGAVFTIIFNQDCLANYL